MSSLDMKQSSRRDFIKISAQAAAFLAIGFDSLANGTGVKVKKMPHEPHIGVEINPYVLINESGKVTLFNARPDMGQGTSQSIPMLIAEELEVRLDQVEIVTSDGSDKFGSQMSGGSSSVSTRYLPMRTVGAAVKEMLIQAAANQWKVPVSACYAKEGRVYQKNKSISLGYGELVASAAKLPVPKNPTLKNPADFTQIGKSIPRPEVPSKVNGTAIFGMDVVIPGMLYASVAHAPSIHAKVKSYQGEKAIASPGVKFVLKTERKMPHASTEAVAVLADSYYSALKGKRLLDIQWESAEAETMNTDKYFNQLHEAGKSSGFEYKESLKGDVEQAFSSAKQVLEASYQTPFLAHAAMEPENATVYVQDGKVEVWAPVQGPDSLVTELAAYLGLKKEQVKINVTFLGGAFGRKAYYDYVLEAAHLSKQINAPVKVVWTREDDIQQGPFRPGMLSVLKGSLDAQGIVTGFEHKMNGASILNQVFKVPLGNAPDPWAEEGINLHDSPYAFPNRRNSFSLISTQIPILWWRSVYASNNLFGQESFIDELAHAAKKDPLEFRLELLKDSPRFVAVLKKLGELSHYQQLKAQGKSIGIAIARSFSSICAHAILVEKQGAGVTIKKVYSVIDCGVAINPRNIKAQVQSNITMGLTAAIKNEITVVNGQTQQSNFHDYAVLRQGEIPEMEIFVMMNNEAPGGVGEPGLPPVAPALCNAVFLATGKRVRKLPFDISQVS
ncbi:xanthine dehydrogenase family protein molybdopterin-binding subunit [Aquirufa rosea]|uniref:Xanthine dehydrogenase family protein molybdopterin-binding subunit n=1 Tax=Aquirufa rosea TaxID=2509241 RepID=A0A4Q1BXW7_9BACT|nr:molybdopterin cofactor-binding domain-containing protein [Aquirufa rosea]RXK47552.1 xanthine dehydrogenase family protein molybdopterin-binding subunit [Aquirufa rosea]